MKNDDKVVCIDVGEIQKLKLYHIYTILNILGKPDQIRLKEIEYVYYKQSRFISLNEYRKIKLENVKNIYN